MGPVRKKKPPIKHAVKKRISVAKKPTSPSSYVIDLRKAADPWLDIPGNKPKPVLKSPSSPRPLLLAYDKNPASKPRDPEHFFLIFSILAHPIRWYKHIQSVRHHYVKPSPSIRLAVGSKPSHLDRLALNWNPRESFSKPVRKKIVTFGIMGALLVLPFQSLQSVSLFKTKKDLENHVATIATALQQGAEPNQLAPSLFELIDILAKADDQIGSGDNLIRMAAFAPIPLGSLKQNAALLEAGTAVSNALKTVMDALRSFSADDPLADKASLLVAAIKEVQPSLQSANKSIQSLSAEDLPADLAPHLPSIKNHVNAVTVDLSTVAQSADALVSMLGNEYAMRYLVLLQNPDELRATGGFIGSYGLLDIEKGTIKSFEIPETGSYAAQGQLTAYLRSPEPMHTINPRWEFQDSNWFADFPTSAQTAMRLYELSHGATVDGVIAINSSVLEGFLEIFGSIESSAGIFTAENALQKIRDDINKQKEEGLAPKQILSTLAPHLTEALGSLTPTQSISLLQLLNSARNSKDILIFSTEAATQRALTKLLWDGSIPPHNSSDYLMVVHTNIGGDKTDAHMQQRILQHIDIAQDGTATKTVTIARTHLGEGSKNRDYLRVFTPLGSTLISASGFSQPQEQAFSAPESWYDEHPILAHIESTTKFDHENGVKMYEAFGKTVFANWVLTAPGQTSIIELKYKLPHQYFNPEHRKSVLKGSPSFTYSFHGSKQSGTKDTELLTSIDLPDGWEPVWLTDETMELGPGMVIHRTTFNADSIFGIVAKKQ